jgi:hypothetical protein
MKRKNLRQTTWLILLLLILVAVIVAPAAAQEPEGEGDVEAQLSFHGGFSLNPFSQLPHVLNGFVAVPQVVPAGGIATTEFMVIDVEDMYSVNLAFDYDAAVVTVRDIRAGSLFDGYTEGVDYIMDDGSDDPGRCEAVAPIDAINEYPIPVAPNTVPPPTIPVRCYVSIAIIDPTLQAVRGNGSLIRIDWDVKLVALGTQSEVDFTLATLLDEFGNRLEPCVAPGVPCQNFRPDPSVFNGPAPDDPFLPPVNFVIGLLQVGPAAPSIDMQVALEGGKAPVAAPPFAPAVDVAVTDLGLVSNFAPNASGAVQTSGAGTLPYDSVEITRPGYMRYLASNVSSFDPPLITLLAGDINADDSIDIFDILLVVANFNLPVNANNEKMNFNADTRITIADIALVAKNFGLEGPSPITPGPAPSPTPTR